VPAGKLALPNRGRGTAAAARGLVSRQRFVVLFFAGAGIALLPWTIWLTQQLPSHHTDEHWRALWVGFDLALAGALIGTAVSALRRSPLVEPLAAAAGTLLLCDVWFDTLLESGNAFWLALLEAAALELPMAVVCFWVALDARRLFS
jgi:hypothetical protein